MLFLLLLKLALACVALIVIAFVIGYAAYIYHIHRKYDHIPGPKRNSFISGHSSILKKAISRESTFGNIFVELHQQYGPLCVIYMWHFALISAADPKTVKEILLGHNYLKPAFNYALFVTQFGERFMGYGLVSETNHEKWEPHRRIMNPAFHRKYLMELINTFNHSGDKLVRYLTIQADGKTEVKLMDAFERYTLDVICKVAFSMEGDFIFNESPFSKAIALALDGMSQSMSITARLDPRKKMRDYRRDSRNSIKFLRKTGTDIITKRLADLRLGKDLPKDILSYVIKVAMEDENYNVVEMVDEFVTFFVAGQETTSNLLSFAMLCLTQNPDVMKRVMVEMDSVIGDKESIEYTDIIKLDYMMLVLKETLRLYPPVSGTSRVIPNDMVVAGYKIPAGSTVSVSTYVMSRMDEFFIDPLTFDPDRFKMDEDRPLYAYFPFSMGARSCIGQQFALIEARVALCKLLQKLTFKLNPDQDFGVYDRLTLKPTGGCSNYIMLREK